MSGSDHPKRAIFLYLLLTLLLSAPIWGVIIRAGHMKQLPVFLLMWCPGTAGIICCLLLRRSLGSLGWRRPGARYLAIAYALPIAYAGLAYGAVWVAGLGGLNSTFLAEIARQMRQHLPIWAMIAIYGAITGTLGVAFSVLSALGEEIGWRGFLVPELAKQMSFTQLSVVSGVIWGLWHTPELLFAGYNAGTNRAYGFVCFMLMVVAVSFVFAWLRLKSNSLWPAALLHGAHNAYVQGVFDQLMRDTGHTRWITTEFGAGMIVTIGIFAIYFWGRRAEVEGRDHSAARAGA